MRIKRFKTKKKSQTNTKPKKTVHWTAYVFRVNWKYIGVNLLKLEKEEKTKTETNTEC